MEDLVKKIASALQFLRHKHKWSLGVTSKKTGVSKSMLGQIERGESSPTIATLWKMASGFNVSFSSFLEYGKQSDSLLVSRQASMQQLHHQNDSMRIISSFPYDESLRCELFTIELLPKSLHLSPSHQQGVIEHVIVNMGEMDLLVDGKWHLFKQHEGMRFNAHQPHGYRNSTDKKVIFQNVVHYQFY